MTLGLLNALRGETTKGAAANIYNDLFRLLSTARIIDSTIAFEDGDLDGVTRGIPADQVEILEALAKAGVLSAYLNQVESQAQRFTLGLPTPERIWRETTLGSVSRRRLEEALKKL